MMGRVAEREEEFDVIHFHIDQFQFPVFQSMAGRTVTTLHGRQDCPDLKALYAGFPEMPLVSISNAQRAPIPSGNFLATVYHGLPLNLLKPTFHPRGGYLAFLGRISPEKGVESAIRIARGCAGPIPNTWNFRLDELALTTRIVSMACHAAERLFLDLYCALRLKPHVYN